MTATDPELGRIDGGFRLKRTADGQHFIDVIEMIYSWRVVRTPVAAPCGYDVGYCYWGQTREGGKVQALADALAAAWEWDGNVDRPPTGFNKKI